MGRSATSSVVLSSIFVIMADVILVRLICDYRMRHYVRTDIRPVEVRSSTLFFFGSQNVLNGINLQVPGGKTVAVLGKSGTGKSVLLKLLVGLQTPDSGSIRIAGKEITGLPHCGDSMKSASRWASCFSTLPSTIR